MPDELVRGGALRTVVRDGQPLVQLRCPGCETWGDLDDDQYHGRVSIQCDCGYHETRDLFTEEKTGGG